MNLPVTDICAGGVGTVFGVSAIVRTGGFVKGGRNFFAAFSSGGSVIYLVVMAGTALFQIQTDVMKSNSVALFGALLYAAIMIIVAYLESVPNVRLPREGGHKGTQLVRRHGHTALIVLCLTIAIGALALFGTRQLNSPPPPAPTNKQMTGLMSQGAKIVQASSQPTPK